MKYLINEYIKKLTVDDIIRFAKEKNIDITIDEAIILYTYAKNHYNDFLEKEEILLNEIKSKLKKETYKEVYKLYLEYKIKYLK